MATLIHKVNMLLLEYESLHDLKNIITLVFNQKLLITIIDFCMNTENFSGFGIRLIELLSLEFCEQVAKSEILQVIQGLLRTNDYETVAQCLSFINVLATQISAREHEFQLKTKGVKDKLSLKEPLRLQEVLKPKLMQLILQQASKNPQDSQIEFVHYTLELVNTVMLNAELRQVVLDCSLNGLKAVQEIKQQQELEPGTPDFIRYLKYLEIHPQFTSVPKLRAKI
jgi:hypothetical protein